MTNPIVLKNTGQAFLKGGGEMGQLIRSMDWSSTGLGIPEQWPMALKQTVTMMISNTLPVMICWGPDYIQLYNDAFKPINGSFKHPKGLGGSARDTYSEVWETTGPMFDRVMHGESIALTDFKVPLDRNGHLEYSYYNFSYSPIRDESGGIRGVLVIGLETTEIAKAFERQRVSRENIRNMVKQAPVGMCIIRGVPLVVEEVNDAFLEIIGKQRNEFDNRPYWDVNSEAAAYYSPITENLLRTGHSYQAKEHEIMLVRKGREEIVYVDFVYEPIREVDGSINAIMIVAIEVTQKVLARRIIEKNVLAYQALNEQLLEMNEELTATNEKLTATQNDLYRRNTELAESESRLKMAIESTQLGTWDYYPLTDKLYASGESKDICGFPLNGAISFETFAKQIHPDDRDRVIGELRKQFADRTDGRYEVSFRIYRYTDHSIRWVWIRGITNFNTKEDKGRHIGTILDITESKKAQEAVARSEKLFKSIALNIPKSLIIVIDKDHRYITIEGDIMEDPAFDQRNYKGRNPGETGPLEKLVDSKHLYERVMAGETFSVERKAKTGEDYIVHFVPLKNEVNEEVDAGLIIAFDITNIKQAEEKSAKLAAIIQSSDDAIISKTLESVITSWNAAAERIFGYTAAEMIGQTIYKLIPGDRQGEEPHILSRLKNGERVDHFETKRVTKDGRLIDVSVTVSPVRDGQGSIIGLSKIARDISEKKLDEARKNDFIGMVSHELKTPLTTLTALLQVLQLKAKNNADHFLPAALAKANGQVKKMADMINGFLNVSRLESGKIMIDKQDVNLGDLIKDVISEMELTVSTHVIKLQPYEQIIVNADADKISSVITNLISNAVKYSPAGTTVEINVESIGDSARVSVKDKGMGIKQEDKLKLFERYYRVENTLVRHISGFGIGLYLCSEIVHRHGGEIWVESEEGNGSTFFFSLPGSRIV